MADEVLSECVDYCYECEGYGDDYFINDDGDIECYCQHCAFNQYEDEEWED